MTQSFTFPLKQLKPDGSGPVEDGTCKNTPPSPPLDAISVSGDVVTAKIKKTGQGIPYCFKLGAYWEELWDSSFCGNHNWTWTYRKLPADGTDGACAPLPATLSLSSGMLHCVTGSSEHTYVLVSNEAIRHTTLLTIDISVTGYDEGGAWDEHTGSTYKSALLLHIYGDSNTEHRISGSQEIDVSSLGTIWLIRIIAQGAGSYDLNSIILKAV